MQRIILATNNAGKVAEFEQLLAPFNLAVSPQADFKLLSVAETGLTFIENAIIKARYAAEKTGLPALADDSGLSVDALKGAPGIYSARYAGEHGDFSANCEKLLAALTDVPFTKRTARFHCVLAYLQYPDDPAPIVCHGTWEGHILTEMRGTKGFGYDPIFYVASHKCSAAELEPLIKNQMSHRAKAFSALVQQLKVD
jgi:XTP/dITP diphosphohydrolase